MSPKGVAARFRQDPGPALLDLIRDFRKPVGKREIVGTVTAAGIDEQVAENTWRRLLPLLKDHPRIRVVKSRSYEWASDPVGPTEALARMRRVRRTRTPPWLMDALAEVVESGLRAAARGSESGSVPKTKGDAGNHECERAVRAAQERQWRIDVVRAVAEVAMAVEEITYKGADPEGILERVRNRALAHSLAPIGRSGDETKFDPALHAPLVGSPDVGSPVLVVRPGYSWRGEAEDVLIERAVVRTVQGV